jgi:HAD superfamily hydrolase (TIGR01549 family)
LKQPTNAIELNLIKLVSWDLDGTLYSIGRMKLRLLRLFMREVALGRAVAARKELSLLKRHRGKIDTARLVGRVVDKRFPGTIDSEALLRAEKRWYGRAIRQVGPRAGVTDVLAFFAARNVPQVIFSDYNASYKLESLKLEDRFASIYIGEHMGFVKPHPAVFKRMAADFNIPITGVLHIGDRVDRDDVAARAAGCWCLILGRDFQSFHELLLQLR